LAEHETTSQTERHSGGHGPGRYVIVWALLIIFTITTVVTGRLDLGGANLPLALAIAAIKATLVVLFFMHMSEAAGANRVVFVVSLVFVVVMMLGVFGDLLTRPAMSLPFEKPHVETKAGEGVPARMPAMPTPHE
jgi:cytochrome c oxidase subunit 4